jgi:signal peptidase II
MPDSASSVKKKKRMPNPAGADYRKLFTPLAILIITAIADQLSKSWAVKNLVEGEIYRVVGSFFQLKLIYNEGGAMGTNLGGSSFYLISAIAILIFVLFFIYTNRNIIFVSWPMALVAGGAVGNIIDRLQSGKVVDFLDFDFFNFSLFGRTVERWWTFNLADTAITIGIILLVLYLILSPKFRKTITDTDSP